MIVETKNVSAKRYAFLRDTRRMRKVAIPAAIVLLVSSLIIVLAFANALPQGLGCVVGLAFLLGVLSLVVLLPLLLFFYGYSRSGCWLDEEGVRVHFPGEDEQRMDWSEALYAIDEGEEYLRRSKGKEGYGHLVARDRYLRLHMEGLLPEQRAEVQHTLAEHVEVRQPQLFTFATLLNSKKETVARGRLYVFENELLCAENRGKRQVFIAAPIRKLAWVREREPFQVGQLLCETFALYYDKKEFIVMLGYEMTVRGALGTSSNWMQTGSAQEWIEALQAANG
ncbi:MAG TPA: hypothetical protein VGD98_21520 [Ktedonobacteraceae bacterium]